ncbi:hypothetical protein AB0A77_23250 [Streptomyces varsoviensis]|uniref:hypothetical protein n=1 Tax=Streptomyces varsoviensis TaxID=67373 RepID=UPI00340ADF94
MTPKRGDHVAPPAVEDQWHIRFADAAAAKGWEELCRQAPGNTNRAWHIMRDHPSPATQDPRHHRLRPPLHAGTFQGMALDRRQLEVTGGGRVWYLVDRDRHTVWIDYAGAGHPRETA